MSLKQLTLNLLFLGTVLSNVPIYTMQESDLEEKCEIASLESLPNELLLLIFYYNIQQIIDENDAIKVQKEFKDLLKTICISNKRFYEFKDDLKKYFDLNKKIDVTDVTFVRTPYKLSFKVGNSEFLIEKGNKKSITDFVEEISKLDNDAVLKKIGEDIVATIKSSGSPDEQRKAFEAMFAQVIYAPYDVAEENGKQNAMNTIKEIVKPIFKAYPDTANTIYTNNLEKYALTTEDIIHFHINNNTES